LLGTFNLTDKDNRMIDLRLGDCLQVMKTIEDNSINAIITDPPYGTTACKWDSVIDFDLMWEQINRIIKPNGAIVLFGSEPFSSLLRCSNINNYKYDLIWRKNIPTGFYNAKKQQLKIHENISVFYKSQPTYNPQMIKRSNEEYKKTLRLNDSECFNPEVYGGGRKKLIRKTAEQQKYKYPFTICEFKTDRVYGGKKHPTQKPVELMEYLIKTYTNENETVLDFTMGSGSTMVACKNTNRNGIGIEKEEKYFKIAQERINSTLF
jgi:site-specific DNA-methyltransferase (adenine-specific)